MEATVIRDVSYHELDLNPPVGKYWSSPVMKKGDVYPVLAHYVAFVRVLYAPDTEVLVSKSAVSFDGGVTPALDLGVRDEFVINVNQGWRDTRVLAEDGEQVLVEYQMPKGTTALRVINRHTLETIARPGYESLPKKWRDAMLKAGTTWVGKPQQASGRCIPSPKTGA